MNKFSKHILKNQEIQRQEDVYKTANLSLSEKIFFYDKKLNEARRIRNEHKNEIATVRSSKTASANVLQFKLDEMTKKMRNEITRLSMEETRHEESQKNETKKIQNQIDFLKENNANLREVLREYLERVINLEKALGPFNK